ncbi:MAG: hypothetical protein HY540_05840 [Deltaproteobacteria bacterium]|nr:hypothetical protein [Deltaproteobacteria bacterium]
MKKLQEWIMAIYHQTILLEDQRHQLELVHEAIEALHHKIDYLTDVVDYEALQIETFKRTCRHPSPSLGEKT